MIRITPEVIHIHASSAAGRLYGLQSLAQIISAAPRTDDQAFRIACRDIIDAPRFSWRGFMLDESRHFAGQQGVMRLLDAMARFKLNRFHWHLTAYPQHDGDGYTQPNNPGEWPRFTFNPAKKETLELLDDILAEVAGLFPDAGISTAAVMKCTSAGTSGPSCQKSAN